MLLALLILITPRPPVEAALQAALKGVPNSSGQFRDTFDRVLTRYSQPTANNSSSESNFLHPTGWPEATIASLNNANEAFLIVSNPRRTTVQHLGSPTSKDIFYAVEKAVRIGHDLVVYGREDGGACTIPNGQVYHLSHGRWRAAQSLDALSEEAWLGKGEVRRPEFRLDPSKRETIRFVIQLRDAPKLLGQSHSSPWLRYEERWVFSDGRLRRVSRRRLETPLAEMDDLSGLVARGRRQEFDARVPNPLQHRLWHNMQELGPEDGGLDPVGDSPDSDQNSDLSRQFDGHGWTVTLAESAGHWRVARLGKPKPKHIVAN